MHPPVEALSCSCGGASPVCLVAKTIANAGNRHDETGFLRDRFDFPAQLGHIHVQAVCPGMRLGSPDQVQQHLPCQYFATVRDENFEQVIFGGRQLHLLPIELHDPRGREVL